MDDEVRGAQQSFPSFSVTPLKLGLKPSFLVSFENVWKRNSPQHSFDIGSVNADSD